MCLATGRHALADLFYLFFDSLFTMAFYWCVLRCRIAESISDLELGHYSTHGSLQCCCHFSRWVILPLLAKTTLRQDRDRRPVISDVRQDFLQSGSACAQIVRPPAVYFARCQQSLSWVFSGQYLFKQCQRAEHTFLYKRRHFNWCTRQCAK